MTTTIVLAAGSVWTLILGLTAVVLVRRAYREGFGDGVETASFIAQGWLARRVPIEDLRDLWLTMQVAEEKGGHR